MFSQGQGRTEAAGVLRLQTRQGHREDGGHEEVLRLHAGATLQGGEGGADHPPVRLQVGRAEEHGHGVCAVHHRNLEGVLPGPPQLHPGPGDALGPEW